MSGDGNVVSASIVSFTSTIFLPCLTVSVTNS